MQHAENVRVNIAFGDLAGLDGGDVSLLTEESRGYVLKFKSIELWEGLRQRFG